MRNAPRNKAMGPPIIDRERSDSESDELMLVDYNPQAKRMKVENVQAGATVLFDMIVEHNQSARKWNDGVECFLAFVQIHHSGLKYTFDKTKLEIPCNGTKEKTVVLISPSLSFTDNTRPVIPSPVIPSSPEDNLVIPSPVFPSSPEVDVVFPSPVFPSSPEDDVVFPSPVFPSSPENV